MTALPATFAFHHPQTARWFNANLPTAIRIPIQYPVVARHPAVPGWSFEPGCAFTIWPKIGWVEHPATGALIDEVDPATLPELTLELEVRGAQDFQRDRLVWSSHRGTLSRRQTHEFCTRIDGRADLDTVHQRFCELRIIAESPASAWSFGRGRAAYHGESPAISQPGPARALFHGRAAALRPQLDVVDPFSYRHLDPAEANSRLTLYRETLAHWERQAAT